ncbi:TetR family transcriptional regulator C-terminal domain-containing protein [Phenylobacterium sp. J367]|nr:TetR family transcriptional regulator C-terminal domain-containing protein [Phenylobacterium sp. J367]
MFGGAVRAVVLSGRFSREPSEVRREALIEAALASLADRGLGAVSVRDVAKRAGVSPGLVRHHFGGFGQLLVEAYRSVVARIDMNMDEALLAAGPNPRARLEAFLEASFSPAIVDRDLLAAWLGFWGFVRTDPDAAKVHAETYQSYRTRIEGLLADLGVENPRPAALGLSALLDGLWLELCLDPTTFTPAEAVRLARHWVSCYTSV